MIYCTKEKCIMNKAQELIERHSEEIYEMANLVMKQTGVPYVIHIRTLLETPGHPDTPSLKIYQSTPGDSDNFSLTISENPVVPNKQQTNKFLASLSGKDFNTIKKWVILNHVKLLNFYFHGMKWTDPETTEWKRSLGKV
jgi:hypothetical protein